MASTTGLQLYNRVHQRAPKCRSPINRLQWVTLGAQNPKCVLTTPEVYMSLERAMNTLSHVLKYRFVDLSPISRKTGVNIVEQKAKT